MGFLRRAVDGALHPLRARHLVGRSPSSDLVLSRREVSGDHAAIRWTGRAWEIRDLGSRNGTWLNDEKLAPGDQRELAPGMNLAFGSRAEVYRVEDAGPPATCATAVAGGAVRSAVDGLLALPDDESPSASIFAAADGRWVLEHDGAVEFVQDRQIVEVDGRAYLIFLAAPVELTLEPSPVKADISAVRLRFSVSRDEEHVSLRVRTDAGEISLGSRSFHYLLLTLARQRIQDQALPDVPASAHGWVYQDELLKRLGIDANKFGVDIFRARRQLLEAGIDGAASIVERRALSRQLRIGVADLEVVAE